MQHYLGRGFIFANKETWKIQGHYILKLEMGVEYKNKTKYSSVSRPAINGDLWQNAPPPPKTKSIMAVVMKIKCKMNDGCQFLVLHLDSAHVTSDWFVRIVLQCWAL